MCSYNLNKAYSTEKVRGWGCLTPTFWTTLKNFNFSGVTAREMPKKFRLAAHSFFLFSLYVPLQKIQKYHPHIELLTFPNCKDCFIFNQLNIEKRHRGKKYFEKFGRILTCLHQIFPKPHNIWHWVCYQIIKSIFFFRIWHYNSLCPCTVVFFPGDRVLVEFHQLRWSRRPLSSASTGTSYPCSLHACSTPTTIFNIPGRYFYLWAC